MSPEAQSLAPVRRLLPTPVRRVTDSDLLRTYGADAAHPDGRPWVRLNFVASVDGAATALGRSGALSTDADRRLFDLLRFPADVVLVGAGTLRLEEYGPMILSADAIAWRRNRGRADHPVLAVVTGQLDLDARAPAFVDAPVRPIIYTTRSSAERAAHFDPIADVVAAGDHSVDPTRALADLRARGHRLIHCEGGPTLAGHLLECDAIDELCLTISPRLDAGPSGRITSHALPITRMMRLAAVHEAESALLARYVRADREFAGAESRTEETSTTQEAREL